MTPKQKRLWSDIRDACNKVGVGVCGIYRFTCKRTARVYIGQSTDIAERIKQHARGAENIHAKSGFWHKSLRAEGGVSGFRIDVIETLPMDRVVLTERENHWLNFYGAGVSSNCFNTHPRAGLSPFNTVASPVVSERIRIALTGRPRPQSVKERISATKLTPEGKARNSAANKGRKHTDKAIAAMTAAQNRPDVRARNSALRKGKPFNPVAWAASKTPEARAKISAAHKGRVHPIEMRQRISATMTGVKHTAERRLNQSKGRKRFLAKGINPWKGRKHSAESRAKMSASRKKFLNAV